MRAELSLVDSFFRVLVEEIRREAPEYLDSPFTVAEIYQSLVPYRSHRDRIGAEMNGDYEDALLRLLSGEGDYLELESDTARERIRLELRSSNPNTGLFREFAAVGVRLNRSLVPPAEEAPAKEGAPSENAAEALAGLRVDPPDEVPSSSSRSVSRTSHSNAADAPGETATRTSAEAPPTADPSLSAPEPTRSAPEPADRPAEATAEADGVDAAPDACPECSSDLPRRDSLRFCPFCGINVFVVPCGECGEVLERSWSFCVACGTAAD